MMLELISLLWPTERTGCCLTVQPRIHERGREGDRDEKAGRGWEPIKRARRVEREFEGSGGGGDSRWTLSRREGETQGSHNSSDCCVQGGVLLVGLCERRDLL